MSRLWVCHICCDPSCEGRESHRLIPVFTPFELCRHKWIIEEGGKHCNLCKAVVYDRSVEWVD